MKVIVYGFFVLILVQCSPSNVRNNDERERPVKVPSQAEKAVEPNRVKRVARKVDLSSIRSVLNSYKITLNRLALPESDENQNMEQDIAGLKSGLANHLPISGATIKILTNPATESAWFGDTLILTNTDGKAFFISRSGKFYSEDWKNRLLGGTYVDDEGNSQLLMVFHGTLSAGDFYHAYCGTQKAKILAFDLDRQNSGSITGSIRHPSGKTLALTRNGRDNKTVQINGKPINYLFD